MIFSTSPPSRRTHTLCFYISTCSSFSNSRLYEHDDCTVKFPSDKDVLRTDRDHPLFNGPDSPKLVQLEDILKTYVMYNFDLGNSTCISIKLINKIDTITVCFLYRICPGHE